MNTRFVLKNIGRLLLLEAACMLPPLLVSIPDANVDTVAFVIADALLWILGFFLRLVRIQAPAQLIDGYALVGLGWIAVTAFGAIPYVVGGFLPAVPDAIFETASGFTTTGASVFTDVESLPKSVLLWRSMTNWVGGVGVLALLAAILPSLRESSQAIVNNEMPGPMRDKTVFRARQTAILFCVMYAGLTALTTALYAAGGMSLFDALLHAFATASTGGFSSKNLSFGAFDSVYLCAVATIFMLLFATNMTLLASALRGRNGGIRAAVKDEELRFFYAVVAGAVLLVTLNLITAGRIPAGQSLSESAFQVSSVVTTTGFSSADFDAWPATSKYILVMLMFLGGCAGSTAGGMKAVRILLLAKIIRANIQRRLHPRAMVSVKLNGAPIEGSVAGDVQAFFLLYMAAVGAGILIVSLDGFDFNTTVTAVVSALSNVGPGLGMVGPMGNYADFSALSKVMLSLLMLLGRLEIYPLLLLCIPGKRRA
jgi:trk system potassium uptake protein TrkH